LRVSLTQLIVLHGVKQLWSQPTHCLAQSDAYGASYGSELDAMLRSS